MNQNEMLEEYLKNHDGITPLEAMNELGIYRLSARVADLRQSGVAVKTEMVTVLNRSGKPVKVARYFL